MTERSLLDRIGERLEALTLTEQAASKRTGRGVDVIRNIRRAIESGKTYNPRSDTISILAKALETTPQWLMGDDTGEGAATSQPSGRASGYRPPPQLIGARDMKVFAAAEGGAGEMVVSTEAIDIVARPWYLEHVPEAYAVLITGESMVPAYRPGHLAIINPRLPAMKGEDHIFVAGEERGEFQASIKHLLRWTAKEWTVEQFNPAGTAPFSLPKATWPKALRVVGSYRR